MSPPTASLLKVLGRGAPPPFESPPSPFHTHVHTQPVAALPLPTPSCRLPQWWSEGSSWSEKDLERKKQGLPPSWACLPVEEVVDGLLLRLLIQAMPQPPCIPSYPHLSPCIPTEESSAAVHTQSAVSDSDVAVAPAAAVVEYAAERAAAEGPCPLQSHVSGGVDGLLEGPSTWGRHSLQCDLEEGSASAQNGVRRRQRRGEALWDEGSLTFQDILQSVEELLEGEVTEEVAQQGGQEEGERWVASLSAHADATAASGWRVNQMAESEGVEAIRENCMHHEARVAVAMAAALWPLSPVVAVAGFSSSEATSSPPHRLAWPALPHPCVDQGSHMTGSGSGRIPWVSSSWPELKPLGGLQLHSGWSGEVA